MIDAEHGHLSTSAIIEHIRATVRSDTCAIVRVSSSSTLNHPGAAAEIKRVLDMGADGVMIPNVEDPQVLETLIGYARYPPEGVRGIGAERSTAWGEAIPEAVAECKACPPIVMALLESHTAFLNRESLASVGDVFYIGPADYSASKGFPGLWGADPGAADELLAIKDAVVAQSKAIGVVCGGPEDQDRRRRQGFQLLGLGFDAGLLLRSLHQSLEACLLYTSPSPRDS